MYKLQVYIQGQSLDLFKDENVNLNQTVQNLRDISKIFTDFTQSFTVPASTRNNKVFKHWYNADITGGFSANLRIPATLELSHLPFKSGVIQLESANLKNGKIDNYKITFYGNLVKLTDLFGDDKLDDLDLSVYDHTYTSANIQSGLTSNSLLSGDVIYPLIATRNWVWDAQGTTLQDDDIRFGGGNLNGVNWNELKPAIKVNRIVDAILNKYSISLVDTSFFDDNTENLFMWLSNTKEGVSALGDFEKVICDNESIDTNSEYNPVTGVWTSSIVQSVDVRFGIQVATGFEDIEYSMLFYLNGVPQTETKGLRGNNLISLNLNAEIGDTIECYMRSSTTMTFAANFAVIGRVLAETSTDITVTSTGVVYINSDADNKGNMPDIKVADFIKGLFKMFNLIIEPQGNNIFNIKSLDDWYTDGETHNITQYIDLDKIDLKRPSLNKRIEFKYNETETILGQKYRELNNRGYGDLDADFNYDGGTLSVEAPFDNMLFERLLSEDDGDISEVLVGKSIDEDLNTIIPKPLLFFNRGTSTITDGFCFINGSGTRVNITTYLNCGTESDLTNGYTLNFGAEFSAWDYEENTNSLYVNFWQDYIDDLYNSKRRIYTFKAILPLQKLIKINLNDRLIIRDKKYIINNINSNLVTGECKLELINTDRIFT